MRTAVTDSASNAQLELDPGVVQILLVRHAETEWSKAGRHTGRSNVPLDNDGRAASRGLRERLAGLEPARVLVSPLERARTTCELAGFGSRAEFDDDLMEWDYGWYEGLTTAEIRVRQPGWNAFIDGCPGGEDVDEVARRADRVIDRLVGMRGQPVVLFSHAHFLRVLGARWVGLDPAEGRHLVLNTCSVSCLGYEREQRAITSWNT